jgi:hypothetical protein
MTAKQFMVSKYLKWLFSILEIVVAIWAMNVLYNLVRGPGAWPISGIGLRIDPSTYHLSSATIKPDHMSVGEVFGTVFVRGKEAAPLRRSLTGPLCGVILCKTLVMLVLCDLFRKMFRSIERREVFSTGSTRGIYKAGLLIIALTVACAFLEGSCGNRIVTFIDGNIVAQGAMSIQIRLPATTGMWFGPYLVHGFLIRVDEAGAYLGPIQTGLVHIDLRGILLGLVLIGLGEALRQGLALREENELTV